MLMYGTPDATNINFSGKGIIYNLTSMVEGFVPLRLLIPPNELGKFTDRDFDIAYMHYILDNDNVFAEFFQIIYNLYIGNDVFIVVSNEDWSENILESLLKLIQQRYGYNAVLIVTEEDYMYAENNIISNFAPGYGIYNLDVDKERFSYLMESYRLSTVSEKNPYGVLPYNLEGFIVKE